jgi:hypothetical protein
VWDAATGKPATSALEHHAEVWSAAFSPDGTRVVTASSDKTARVWNVGLDIGALADWVRIAEAARSSSRRACSCAAHAPRSPVTDGSLRTLMATTSRWVGQVTITRQFATRPGGDAIAAMQEPASTRPRGRVIGTVVICPGGVLHQRPSAPPS